MLKSLVVLVTTCVDENLQPKAGLTYNVATVEITVETARNTITMLNLLTLNENLMSVVCEHLYSLQDKRKFTF